MHRPFGAEDRAGVRREAGPAQELLDQAVVGQKAHPGIDADQERGPERQHDQHQQQRPPVGRGAGDGIGHGIAQQQGHEGRGRRDAQRGEPGRQIEVVGEEQREALEAEAQLDRRHRVGRIGSHRDGQHQQAGQQKEDPEPQEREPDDEPHRLDSFHFTLTHLPHPEERREAARLEGWATGTVRVPTPARRLLRATRRIAARCSSG